MINIFRPSWKKVFFTLILFGLAWIAVYLILSSAFECMMNWGCDGIPGQAFLGYSLGIFLVLPVYMMWFGINLIFSNADWLQKTNVAYSILGFLEIIYLYFLGCLLPFLWKKHKESKRRDEILEDNLRAEVLKAETLNSFKNK